MLRVTRFLVDIINFMSSLHRYYILICVGKRVRVNVFRLPDNVDEFSVKFVLFTGRLCPNGLRRLFGLNIRRLYCGGVAHDCPVISANPPGCDLA